MKRTSFLTLFLIGFLSSCSGGAGGGGEASLAAGASTSSISQQEIAALNEALNSGEQYKFTKEELDLLLNEGAINQDEYQELLALVDEAGQGGAQ